MKTESKIFAPDSATFGAAPNTQVSYITLGHPGTLPMMNEKAVGYAVRIGLATNCKIQRENRFDRKNYFYADLPKGYQISQFATPICYEGHLTVKVNGVEKYIRLNRIHLEEDAGKSTHDQDPNYSLIDLNRAGVPLVEIVTEPDIRSSDEAYEYLAEIRKLVQYLDICDGNMEEGSMRCDANVSVRLKGETKLGERTEVKNMNSLRNVKKAIELEAKRQIDIIESGGQIVQETRSFDADRGTTFPLRSKEMAHDYRYFPEPDLPPFIISDEFIAQTKADMPALPSAILKKMTTEYGLSEYDASVLTDEQDTALFFLALVKHTQKYKAAANWMLGPIKSHLKDNDLKIKDLPLSFEQLTGLIHLVEAEKVSFSVAAQRIFPKLVGNSGATAEGLAKKMNLLIQKNDDALASIIEKIIADNPTQVAKYKKGQKGVLGFFMGQVMRASKGKVNPKVANKLLAEKLNK